MAFSEIIDELEDGLSAMEIQLIPPLDGHSSEDSEIDSDKSHDGNQYLKADSVMEELIWALKNGDMDGVKTTVESKGFDVNAQLDGRAPIHHAADYGQLEVLQYLSSKGADLNAVDKHGISPLLAAIWEGHTKCVQFMISQGANKNGAAPDGTSYIDSSEKDEIKLLLR